ncbi:MAG TPA: T9SS type A sorting domain-containing protein, partial [Rubricoccaceae bacterium]|nr:T9SS type A sorting domain-containing protein [Rubricoccaceae bacterium]
PEGVCVDGSPSYPRKFACWSRTAGWLPTGDVGAGEVYALARPTDGKVYVGGTFTQVFQLDGMPVVARNIARWTGTAWEHIGGPTGVALGEVSVKALTVGPDGALYVGGRFDAVYQPDGTLLAADRAARFDGATWSALPSPGGHTVEALAFGPDGRLYAAGTHGTEPNGALSEAGVAVLDVSAETWHPLGTGLGGRGEALAFDGVGRLFVGGWFDVAGGKGSPGLAVWNAPIAVPAEPLVPEAPRAVVLYPNPARGATTIAFALYAAGLVRVAAYDALGRRVAVLTDGARAAGQHTLTLDTSGLPGGVYVVRVEAGGHTQSRLLTVLR